MKLINPSVLLAAMGSGMQRQPQESYTLPGTPGKKKRKAKRKAQRIARRNNRG